MPVTLALAGSFGLTGYEAHAQLASDSELLRRIDAFRVKAGQLLGLGDVRGSSVPKTVLLAPPRDGGQVCTRSFIPVQPHTSIGVLAASPEALERRVKEIEASGRGAGWADGDPGYGPVYVFTDPDGHEFGLYYDSEWYTPPAELKPSLKNQAQAYPARGVSVRRLDHINFLGVEVVPNRDYLRDVLGAMVTEQIVLDDGTTAGSWTTFTNKGYDAVYTRDWTGTPGRLHHLAFAVDTRGCNLNPDPSGGHWTSPPLTDRSWYPFYEAMAELDVPAMVHVSAVTNPSFHATGSHYLNADTTAFMQLLQADLFRDFPGLRLVIPHGGGAVPYHWSRFRGLADMLGRPAPEESVMGNVFFDTCVYHQPGIDLLFEAIGVDNILFGSEMVGAVRGIDPRTGHCFDDSRRYVEALNLAPGDREKVFELNARRVYPRLDATLKAQNR